MSVSFNGLSPLQAQKDVEEVRTLMTSASRKRVQDMLANELRRMEIEVSASIESDCFGVASLRRGGACLYRSE